MTHPTRSEADREFRLAEIDLALFSEASDVHAIHMAAYALEASMLNLNCGEFPPLLRSAEDLQSDGPCTSRPS
jgi:hypothetical protein